MAVASGTLIPLDTAIKETIEYTRTRHAFGQPILDNQYIHFKLAELQTELELFRALTYQAADAMETFDVTWRYQHFEASGVNF